MNQEDAAKKKEIEDIVFDGLGVNPSGNEGQSSLINLLQYLAAQRRNNASSR
jgi:hypothetical protein